MLSKDTHTNLMQNAGRPQAVSGIVFHVFGGRLRPLRSEAEPWLILMLMIIQKNGQIMSLLHNVVLGFTPL